MKKTTKQSNIPKDTHV